MALINKKKLKKKVVVPKNRQQKAKPQTTALGPASSQSPIFEPRPFVPSTAPTFSATTRTIKPFTSKPQFDPEKEFLKTFKELTYRHRAWDVWNDFVVMAACALSNPVDKEHYNEREERYLRIIKKYNKDEQYRFPKLFAHTVMALELNPEQDFLGKLYLSLNLFDEGRKQHFTPYGVCELMADIAMEKVVEQVRESGYITINDPCCGAGATLIAGIHSARRSLEKVDLNFQNHILVAAQDIDETVALMCYIQLSLLGIAAYIKVGDTITDPMKAADTTENYWFTPMYFSDVWSMRRLVHKMDELCQTTSVPKPEKKPFKLLVKLEEDDCCCSLVQFYEKIAQKAGFTLTEASRFNCAKIRCTEAVQNTIFNYYSVISNGDELGISMLWVNSGPKADLKGNGYAVEIEDGFVIEGDG